MKKNPPLIIIATGNSKFGTLIKNVLEQQLSAENDNNNNALDKP
jgi:hypothetical protein